ncbi:hypothetical protein BG011_003307 [Mortierella polycephala]|uniref:Uncharacterized protein n=1 Tax=Mortierella polycephala TaxID=41804 RepID=A0A9P6QDB3_9FUNG|nr:hypothetical protein BG011_003307 [Mortierella polycephala]
MAESSDKKFHYGDKKLHSSPPPAPSNMHSHPSHIPCTRTQTTSSSSSSSSSSCASVSSASSSSIVKRCQTEYKAQKQAIEAQKHAIKDEARTMKREASRLAKAAKNQAKDLKRQVKCQTKELKRQAKCQAKELKAEIRQQKRCGQMQRSSCRRSHPCMFMPAMQRDQGRLGGIESRRTIGSGRSASAALITPVVASVPIAPRIPTQASMHIYSPPLRLPVNAAPALVSSEQNRVLRQKDVGPQDPLLTYMLSDMTIYSPSAPSLPPSTSMPSVPIMMATPRMDLETDDQDSFASEAPPPSYEASVAKR